MTLSPLSTTDSSTADAATHAVPLTQLDPGAVGKLHTFDLPQGDRRFLSALGLSVDSRLRLCKTGSPWIVQVRGTRIGLSEVVARQLLVVPEAHDAR